jgi:TonB-linked SusC/RagA family outer membrane protein
MKRKVEANEFSHLFRMVMLAILLALNGCFVSSSLIAQTTTVSGSVKNTSGETLPGVAVSVKGTTVGTITDIDGKFTLTRLTNGATLSFTFVGMKPQEIKVGTQKVVNLVMIEESIGLEEVVAIGYGTSKKSDLAGAVASVSADAIKSAPITSFEQGMQGRIAGVSVVQGNSSPGGAPQVRIRGANTVLGGNEPLYVIDGVPVYNSELLNQNGLNIGTQPSNALAAINPNDIVSMEILKDASATAIYGARGANGIVIITTKRGKAGTKGSINFEASYGVQEVSKKLDMMNAQDFIKIYNERQTNIGQKPGYANPSAYTTSTDWQDLMFQMAPVQNYTLSYSGGNDQNQYSVSGNWFEQEGVVINTGFKRGSFRVNLDNKINDRIKFTTSFTVSRSINDRASNWWLSNAISALPTLQPYNTDGSYNNFQTSEVPVDPNNPIELADKQKDRLTVDRMLGNVLGEFKILDGLVFSVRLGIDDTKQLNDLFTAKGAFTFPTPGATVKQNYNTNLLNEELLTFNKVINKIHRINAVAGFTWQENTNRYFQQGGSGFQFDFFETNNLSAATITDPNYSSKSKSTILSWLGRANYIFDDKYIVTFTARADGSSRFGENNKWGFFPSAALAWRVSKENFMKNIEFINDLKVRTSYGATGNQEIGSYNSISRMSSVTGIMGGTAPFQSVSIGYVPTSLANKELKWETTRQIDAGVDLSILKGHLSLTADYYKKRTEDLLANLPIPGSSGFTSILINSGVIENEGYEFSVNSPLLAGEFKLDLNANIGFNKTTVVDLAVESKEFLAESIPSPIDAPINIIREGEVLSAFYGFQEDGLTATGDIKYKDLNNDGVINDKDKTILGSPYPKFTYGFTSNASYKGFFVNLFLQGSQGAKVFNSNDFVLANSLSRIGNQLIDVNNRWTAQNPDPYAKYPRASNIANKVSDRFVKDASYLRLKNISIGYNVPTSKFGIKWMQAARVYVSAQNLFTITKYDGYDPEVSQTGTSSLVKGLDRGSYPSAKTYNVGLNITF